MIDHWDTDEIVELYRAGGWWKEWHNPSAIPLLIKGSYLFAVAVDQGRAIGMGRVISDGIADGYIQDVVVFPKYQNRGIGKKIVSVLLEECKKRGIEWIGLVAEPDSEPFYLSLGFRRMEGHVPLVFRERD